MTETLDKAQLVVLGGGPGGYAAAFLGADLGMQVTLVDLEENPGGVCLYRGCIPSKALLHLARLLTETREAEAWGLTFTEPTVDLDKMRGWKDTVVQQLTGGTGQLAKQRRVTMIQGRGTFLDGTHLHIEEPDGSESILPFEHAIIATGSRPATVPSFPMDSPKVMDSTAALELADIPDKLLVVGGGYIGLELGSVYAALGSKVTVVEMAQSLLAGADKDLVRPLAKRLDSLLDSILLKTTVTEMVETDDGIRVTLQGDKVETPEQTFDKVLVAIGRKPNTEGLGLSNTKVEINERGFIKTDGQRRTAEPTIFAIGDVAGDPMLAHKASHEGRLAVEVIAGSKAHFEPAAIPAVVFTDPEIAWCGLTEAEAKAEKRPVKAVRFPWAASGRAKTMGREEGMTKLIIDEETERILGVGIVGAGAAELIAEGMLAIEMGAVATDLKLTIHPHPTLTETIMEASDVLFGQSTHVYRPLRKKRN
ncbi:MAG: dihydrolipoyl dehydrogenase [Chloroflexota bacterium]